jgi:tetratricopeptide (TPR) repeat protein
VTRGDEQSVRVAAHCRAGRCAEAISALEEQLRDQPANPELHHQLGVCYGGACRPHNLVSMPVSIAYFERALALIGSGGPRPFRARCLDSLGNAWLESRRPAVAIPFLSQAAELYRALGLADDWAREQFNLGSALCDVPAPEAPAKWQRAIEHYRQALTVRTKERDPLRFAATVQNLGTAWRERPDGDRESNVRAAIRCYGAALRVYRRDSFPAQHAALHNNLGNAYLSLPGSAEAAQRNIRRALRHFARALEGRPRDRNPFEYAATQFNRGQAFARQAEFESGAGLSEAAGCFREAEECFRICRDAGHAAAAHRAWARTESR